MNIRVIGLSHDAEGEAVGRKMTSSFFLLYTVLLQVSENHPKLHILLRTFDRSGSIALYERKSSQFYLLLYLIAVVL